MENGRRRRTNNPVNNDERNDLDLSLRLGSSSYDNLNNNRLGSSSHENLNNNSEDSRRVNTQLVPYTNYEYNQEIVPMQMEGQYVDPNYVDPNYVDPMRGNYNIIAVPPEAQEVAITNIPMYQAGFVQHNLAIYSHARAYIEELRYCQICGNTNTPLWRRGPDGPQTLCNACGLRHARSARRNEE